jgi:hypothetical protein
MKSESGSSTMKISRRNFMGVATSVTVATFCSFRAIGLDKLVSRPGHELDCVLLEASQLSNHPNRRPSGERFTKMHQMNPRGPSNLTRAKGKSG